VRQLFEIVLPLILPTVIYLAYALLLRPRSGGNLHDMPWVWLGVAGGFLLAVTFLAIALLGGAPPAAHYVPPKVVNGQIEPGHYETSP
jgi:hypothetical protein